MKVMTIQNISISKLVGEGKGITWLSSRIIVKMSYEIQIYLNMSLDSRIIYLR